MGEYTADSIEVLKGMDEKVRPEDLPSDHPDHVCTDKCYSVSVINPSRVKDAAFVENKATLIAMGCIFDPCRWHGWKYIDLRDGHCTAIDPGSAYRSDIKYQTELSIQRPWASAPPTGTVEAVANAVAAVEEIPQPAVEPLYEKVEPFDPVEKSGEDSTDKGKDWMTDWPKIDIDAAAPVVQPESGWEPTINIPSMDEIREAVWKDHKSTPPCGCDCEPVGSKDYPAEEVVEGTIKRAKFDFTFACVTVGVIIALVYVYFHYFAK